MENTLIGILQAVNQSIFQRNGPFIGNLLSIRKDMKSLQELVLSGRFINPDQEIHRILLDPLWIDVVSCFWRTSIALGSKQDIVEATNEQLVFVQSVLKGLLTWEAWVLPVLFAVCRDLEILACRADSFLRLRKEKAEKSEEAARLINKAFTVCITDRAPIEMSRKWGTYYIIGILFKIYFKINKFSLSENVLRAIEVSEMPPLECFPKSHVVTYKYYLGVFAFLNEKYTVAETELMASLELCQKKSIKNLELILTYLIPTLLLTSQKMPSNALLSNFLRLKNLYEPLKKYIRKGNLREYDRLLLEKEKELMNRRVYLVIEKIRDTCIRNLFRRVFFLNEKSTRIPIQQFHIALRHAGLNNDTTETECFLANMIYKGFMKGYIHQERQMVILSVKDPFPKTVKLYNF
ncbi:hypothetical protein PORY_001015 [Pneumocystis oryctolagi]|uniref:Uncharacterized protein n=1 Tax=Pneumocystis oryctolagi TaxID=42067 RepID=A0ACB7CEZ8_9ASCO|nr:hypothetical protein PORY_001015 [Pneumocystis oryctolagi]